MRSIAANYFLPAEWNKGQTEGIFLHSGRFAETTGRILSLRKLERSKYENCNINKCAYVSKVGGVHDFHLHCCCPANRGQWVGSRASGDGNIVSTDACIFLLATSWEVGVRDPATRRLPPSEPSTPSPLHLHLLPSIAPHLRTPSVLCLSPREHRYHRASGPAGNLDCDGCCGCLHLQTAATVSK